MRVAAALLVVLAPISAQALSIFTVPSNPVAGTPFLVRITTSPCFESGVATINGTNIDIQLTVVPIQIGECEATVAVPVGGLPAGAYTIRFFIPSSPTPIATQALLVSADVPATDPHVLGLLAVALILIATLRLRA